MESDGDGSLLDIVQPCPTCLAPKVVLRPIVRPRTVRPLIGVKRSSPLMALALGKAKSLVEQGELTTAKIAGLTGISQDAVRRLRHDIESEAPQFCGCGKPATHGGRCSWRRAREKRE